MDWLQIIADIAQVFGVVWVLFFGGKAVIDVIQDTLKHQPIKVSPATVTNVLLALILLALLSLRFSPVPNPPPNPTPFIPTTTPTEPIHRQGQACTGYYETGKGISQTVKVTVPQGCVLIIDGFKGSIQVSWDGGGVIALAGGNTYSGTLTDGEWLIVSSVDAQKTFCGKVKEVQGAATVHPLYASMLNLRNHYRGMYV
jgi:hypothetical protein